jgi:hypothetical protein
MDNGGIPGATQAWTVVVHGSVTNTTGAPISGAGLAIFLKFVPGDGTGVGSLDDPGVLTPGATGNWSSPVNLAVTPTGDPPSTAVVTNAYWTYSDPSLIEC